MILLSTFLLALACRDNAIVHPSQATATGEVIWPPEDGRIPHDALAPAVLPITNFCLTARASLALGPTQPLCAPGHSLWLRAPGPEKLASRLCPKKGTPGKGNNQIKPQTSSCTGLCGCPPLSPKPQTQIGMTKKHSRIQVCFPWQIVRLLGRSELERACTLGLLPHSRRCCRIGF